jgi:hypothetical protein
MLILLVARPMLARLLPPATSGLASAGGRQAALPAGAGAPALPAPKSSDGAAAVEVDAVQGRVGGELMRRTRDVVEQAPRRRSR